MTDSTEIRRIIQEYYEKVYNTKLNNLEELDQYLERYNLPKLNQEELENLNRPISSMEMETIVKNLPKSKFQDQMASSVKSTKHSIMI